MRDDTECHFVLIIGLFFVGFRVVFLSCRFFFRFGRLSIEIKRTFIYNRLRTHKTFWFAIRKVEKTTTNKQTTKRKRYYVVVG